MSYFSDTADFRWNQACIVDLGAGKFPIWRVGGGLTPEYMPLWYSLTKIVVFLTAAGFGIFGPHKNLGEGPPDGTQTRENPAVMRAGRVYHFTVQGDVSKVTAGKRAAEAPVAWTGESGNGHTES